MQEKPSAPLIAYRKWLAQIGVSATTGWRWIKAGWISPINIAGRVYVSCEEISKFRNRAEAGEFAKAPSGAAAGPVGGKHEDEVRPAIVGETKQDPSRQSGKGSRIIPQQ